MSVTRFWISVILTKPRFVRNVLETGHVAQWLRGCLEHLCAIAYCQALHQGSTLDSSSLPMHALRGRLGSPPCKWEGQMELQPPDSAWPSTWGVNQCVQDPSLLLHHPLSPSLKKYIYTHTHQNSDNSVMSFTWVPS